MTANRIYAYNVPRPTDVCTLDAIFSVRIMNRMIQFLLLIFFWILQCVLKRSCLSVVGLSPNFRKNERVTHSLFRNHIFEFEFEFLEYRRSNSHFHEVNMWHGKKPIIPGTVVYIGSSYGLLAGFPPLAGSPLAGTQLPAV